MSIGIELLLSCVGDTQRHLWRRDNNGCGRRVPWEDYWPLNPSKYLFDSRPLRRPVQQWTVGEQRRAGCGYTWLNGLVLGSSMGPNEGCDDNGVRGAVPVQLLAGRVFAGHAGISEWRLGRCVSGNERRPGAGADSLARQQTGWELELEGALDGRHIWIG